MKYYNIKESVLKLEIDKIEETNEEEELQKLIQNEFEEKQNPESENRDQTDLNIKQLKALIMSESKDLGIKKMEGVNPNSFKQNQIETESKKKKFEKDKVIIVDPLPEEGLEEVDEMELNMMALESLYKPPEKGLELVEKKAMKLKGGGTLIFKRVKKTKKTKKTLKKEAEMEMFGESVGSENDWDLDNEISTHQNSENWKNTNKNNLPTQNTDFLENSEPGYSLPHRDLELENNFYNQSKKQETDFKDINSTHMKSEQFFLESLKKAAQEGKNKLKKDPFLMKLDNMMENEEIIGLSSSDEEISQSNTDNSKDKKIIPKSEFLENLEREYQERLTAQQKNTDSVFDNLKIANFSQMEEEKELMRQEAKRTRKELGKKGGRLKEIQEIEDEANKIKISDIQFSTQDPNLEILVPKKEKAKLAEEIVKKEGINSFLKKQGLRPLNAKAAQKYVEPSTSDSEGEESLPSRAEFFGGAKKSVGECSLGPEPSGNLRGEMLQNYYCIRVEQEELEVKPKTSNLYKRKQDMENFEEDFEEVKEREDLAKKLKRKRGETKQERKKRKAEIKKRKAEVRKKKKEFKEKFEAAKRERIDQDYKARANGIHKGISYHKIH